MKQNQQKQSDQIDEYGAVIGPAAVRIQRVLSATPETVWAYLTESDKCAQWLAALDEDLKEGGAVILSFDHSALTPHDEEVPDEFKDKSCNAQSGTVLVYDPPRKLSYTWGDRNNPSEVTFVLEPQGDRTLLTLTHSKLPGMGDMRGVSSGWHIHLNILRDKLAGKEPPPFWATFLEIRQEYNRLIEGR